MNRLQCSYTWAKLTKSAQWFEGPISTVAGSLKMTRSSPSPPLPHAALTASHTSIANSGSVCESVSGLYSYRKIVLCVAVHSSVNFLTIFRVLHCELGGLLF